ncbi:Eco57I restriction-modification methylase domain-containing protein [Halomicroarcula sp. GCM10025709]
MTYIVEETVGPLVEEIREDLIDQGFKPGTQEYIGPFFRRVTDLRILDPAMGSGHFLTKATGYLSEQVMAEVREAETEFGVAFDEQHIRREIAKECIYGVDLNGMAVELAKLSMWLETLAADRPLAFLDHHFKQGNSLVGSDIEDIEELESDANGDGEQASLAEFGATREGTIERLMDIYSEFLDIENETVEDVREMKRKYAEIEQDELRRRLVAMANVHTAERFGLDVPSGVYERMAKALEDDEEWMAVKNTDWFRSAQATAGEQDFFHWKLAFPEVFYREGGTTREDAGFDAVIGNPPYVKIQNLRRSVPQFADYALQTFDIATGRFDIYALFVKVGTELTADGRLSYILPNKFFESGAGQPLRQYLVSNQLLREIVDFGRHQVFEGVTTYTCILSLQSRGQAFEYAEASEASEVGLNQAPRAEIKLDDLDDEKWALTGPRERNVLDKLREGGTPIKEQSQYLSEGIVSGDNKVLFVEIIERNKETVKIECALDGAQYELESEIVRPLLRGDVIERFGSTQAQEAVVYPHETHRGETRPIPENKLQNEYPLTFEYLTEFKERLADRGTGDMRYREWYALYRSREKQLFEAPKVITPDVCQRCEFTVDHSGTTFLPDTAYGIVPERNEERHREYLLAVLNSAPMWFFVYHTSSVLRGDFRRFKTSYLSPLPVPDSSPATERETEPTFENVIKDKEMSPGERLSDLACVALNLSERRDDLNLALLDYIQPYSEGPSLTDIGIYQPPEGVGDTKLAATKEEYGNIRIGTVTCEREDQSTVIIHATARYKPDDEDAYETDQWGYTETEPMPAMRLTDLSEIKADLVEAFVPVAVKEAGGFAGFRETTTKTNSLVDRLEAITLPDPDDVADDLKRYREAIERAEELDGKIQRTDDLINQIVYDLYGLTDEEIEIVEEAVVNE